MLAHCITQFELLPRSAAQCAKWSNTGQLAEQYWPIFVGLYPTDAGSQQLLLKYSTSITRQADLHQCP